MKKLSAEQQGSLPVKGLKDIIVSMLFSVGFLVFAVLTMGISINDVFIHVTAIRNNETVIGTVQGMTSRVVGSGKRRHKVYTIVFSYEYDGLAYTGEFETRKDIPDLLSGSFESRYREGNRMPVLLVQDGSLIVVVEKKKVIARDITAIVFGLFSLAVGLFMLFRLIDVLWELLRARKADAPA